MWKWQRLSEHSASFLRVQSPSPWHFCGYSQSYSKCEETTIYAQWHSMASCCLSCCQRLRQRLLNDAAATATHRHTHTHTSTQRHVAGRCPSVLLSSSGCFQTRRCCFVVAATSALSAINKFQVKCALVWQVVHNGAQQQVRAFCAPGRVPGSPILRESFSLSLWGTGSSGA